jgi:NDP-sugar pyrophosphorylase family protein
LGAEAAVGPDVILENGVVVDAAAEIRSSVVGPDTYVGTLTRIEHSIAWGNMLIDWRTGSCTHVPDPFLLCALGQRYMPEGLRSSRASLGQNLFALLKRPLRSSGSNQIPG